MKTITIKFQTGYFEEVGKLLHSLELKILMSYSEEGFMDANNIVCLLKLNNDNNAITPNLQIEKLREKSFIKIVKM